MAIVSLLVSSIAWIGSSAKWHVTHQLGH